MDREGGVFDQIANSCDPRTELQSNRGSLAESSIRYPTFRNSVTVYHVRRHPDRKASSVTLVTLCLSLRGCVTKKNTHGRTHPTDPNAILMPPGLRHGDEESGLVIRAAGRVFSLCRTTF